MICQLRSLRVLFVKKKKTQHVNIVVDSDKSIENLY